MKVIERELTYWKGKPVMVLKSAGRDNKKRAIITLADMWKYSDSHNEQFESFMANRMIQFCRLFEIQVPTRKQQFAQMMASMSDTIMTGIDELVKMPPPTDVAAPDIDRQPLDIQQIIASGMIH